MKELILIDGNSLLNRAYYATKLLTTRDGVPTNAVYGFIKLLLKIIDDNKPDRLIVAFDLKAPTFRHKMYDGYKATRKPMPDDLVVQVDMLKSLLRSMNICMCEKEGYEADDLVGTLSHAFPDTHSIIITGDRDAYQLVDDATDVYITKTGVSELLKLNIANFEKTLGFSPAQVVDIKALMGDTSDNIPGVSGIGEKTALSLISKYENLETIYDHLDEIGGAVKTKLENGKESAFLSRSLATIDRNVPLDLSFDEGHIRIPFSVEVRDQFLKLEFVSLLKLPIFEEVTDAQNLISSKKAVSKNVMKDVDLFFKIFDFSEFSAIYYNSELHVYADKTEYILIPARTLLDDGIAPKAFQDVLKFLFSRKEGKAILYGKKVFRHMLRKEGVDLNIPSEDVSIMKYLVDFSGKDTDDFGAVLKSYAMDETIPAAEVFSLYEYFAKRLQAERMESLYRDVELPLADVLYDMEVQGVKIDLAASAQFEGRYREEIAKRTAEIYEQAGEVFNINSPAQLGKILFEKLHLPAPKKGKSGSYSTSAEVLEKLSDSYKIVQDVLACRHFQKLLSTYIDGFKPLIDAKTGLVHTTYNQVLTTTGRLSSTNPNLQNIPIRDEEGRELRKLFVARSPDRVLVDADYSQIELRLLAHFSGCKELVEAYQNNKDIHTLTASQVFSVSEADVTPAQRRAAKAVNFGIIYGISEFGLASNLHISNRQAGDYIRKYFETYTDVKEYMDKNVEFARKNGYITTLLGRKRIIPEIKSSNFNLRSFGERAAMNMPLQGSSADIIKIAMRNVYERIQKEGLRSRLILQVHDELVIDAFSDECEQICDLLKYEMEHAVQLNVPLIVEVCSGRSWYDAK